MSDGHRKRRVRVITDKAKYRKHQRKKLARKLVKVALWAAAILVAVVLIWLGLDMLFRPRPLPQD